MDNPDSQFDQTIKNADALLGLLDGTRIMSLIKNEKLGKIWSVKELPNILSIMQTTNKPIHFVISKWDIVQNHYTIEEIRECLLEIEEFKNLVKTRNQSHSPIRLIPVSSVGTGFADLQPDGSMKKTGKMPQPFQVEMPLSCIFPDMIQITLNELLKKKEQELSQEIEVQPNLSWWDKLKKYMGGTVNAIASGVQELLPKKYQFAADILDELINLVEEEMTKSVYEKEEIARKRTDMSKAIECWSFLVSRNLYLGYRAVVAPDFICDAKMTSLIARTAGGDVTKSGTAICRQIIKSELGDLTLVFQVRESTYKDMELAGDGSIKDSFGREIRLIEGFIFKGNINILLGIKLTQNIFDSIHQNLKPSYRQFWEWDQPQPAIPSQSFSIQSETEGEFLTLTRQEAYQANPSEFPNQLKQPLSTSINRDNMSLLLNH